VLGMGNSGIVGSGWLYSSDEKTPVVLKLNEARNMQLRPGEQLHGIVTLNPDALEVGCVRRDMPISFAVGADSVISVKFCPTSCASDEILAPAIGEVILPLEHLARRCGRSLYHTWFPLCEISQQPTPLRTGEVRRLYPDGSGDCRTAEAFERAMRNAARDPRWPMVCLSLSPAESAEAASERYELGVPMTDKALRFAGLLQSQAQHARLVQALYKQSRTQSTKPELGKPERGKGPQSREDSWAAPACLRQDSYDFGLPGPADATNGPVNTVMGHNEEVSKLRHEIESTTAEANLRINQASDAIRTLKERLNGRQVENERLRRERARFRHEADALEVENERLALQIERRARERDGALPDDREEEARRLQREADVLREQKEALVLILEDLYGAVGQNDTSQQVSRGTPACDDAAQPADPGIVGATVAREEQGGWKNMLPRPSELFASGVLEAG